MYTVEAAQSRRNGTERVGSAFGPDAELGSPPDIRWQQGNRQPITTTSSRPGVA